LKLKQFKQEEEGHGIYKMVSDIYIQQNQ